MSRTHDMCRTRDMSRSGAAGVTRAVAVFAVLLGLPLVAGAHWVVNLLVFTLMYAGLAAAWNLVGGIAGYPSLGHAAFFGIGAYAQAWLFRDHVLGSAAAGYLPFLLLPAIGVLVAAVGLGVGAAAMRTRSDVFAIVTITLLFVVQTLAYNLRPLTGGSQGVAMPVAPFPADHFELPYYYVLVVLLGLAVGANWATLSSKAGLALRSVRGDEERARGLGIHVDLVKLLAFTGSVGITGMIGGVWAYYVGFIYPQFAIDPLITIGMVLMAYLGGRGTVWGPVLGASIVVPVQQLLAYQLGASRLYLVGYAAVFLVIMLVLPRGILPTLADRHRRRGARTGRTAGATGSPTGTGTAISGATGSPTASAIRREVTAS